MSIRYNAYSWVCVTLPTSIARLLSRSFMLPSSKKALSEILSVLPLECDRMAGWVVSGGLQRTRTEYCSQARSSSGVALGAME
jgi:hypothetical protein